MQTSPGRGLGATAGGFGARRPPPPLAKAPQRAKFAGKAAPRVRTPGAAPAGLTSLSGLIHPFWAGFSSGTHIPEHPGLGWELNGESGAVQTPASPARSAGMRREARRTAAGRSGGLTRSASAQQAPRGRCWAQEGPSLPLPGPFGQRRRGRAAPAPLGGRYAAFTRL